MATLNTMLERIKKSKIIIILFIVLSVLLILSNFPAGGLIALALWLQIYPQILNIPFDRHSQIWAFKVFLCSIPLLLFWGGVHSFLIMHLQEQRWGLLFLSLILDLILVLLGCTQLIWIFQVASSSNFKLDQSFKQAIVIARKNKKYFFFTLVSLFIFSFIPKLTVEWKIVLSIIFTQFLIFRFPLKPVHETSAT